MVTPSSRDELQSRGDPVSTGCDLEERFVGGELCSAELETSPVSSSHISGSSFATVRSEVVDAE